MTDDPDAPAPLAEALRAARGPAPDAESLKRLGVALGIAVPVALAPATTAATAAATATVKAAGAGAAAAKIAIAGVAAVGAATAVAVVGFGVGRAPAPARPVPAAVEMIEKRAPEPFEGMALPGEEPVAPAPAALPAPRRRHPARPAAATAVADEPAAPPEAPSDVASRLREEAALVQRAEKLLDADPAGALRLTDERRRRFPGGALDQEAEVVAIDALLRLGRRADAAARARAFQAAHAGSLHARRIQRLMAQ
jgi:hypothetical protein